MEIEGATLSAVDGASVFSCGSCGATAETITDGPLDAGNRRAQRAPTWTGENLDLDGSVCSPGKWKTVTVFAEG